MKNFAEEIYDSSLKFLSPLGLNQTYELVVREAIKLTQGSGGSILLAQNGSLKRVYASNPESYRIKIRPDGYTYQSYKNKKIVTLTRSQLLKIHPEIQDIPLISDIMVPLINRGRSIGVISLYTNKKNRFDNKDKEILKIFSPLASLAIRKAQLYYELNKSLETRDLFISLASHELKTPITTIYIYLQLIQKNINKNNAFDPSWITTLLFEMTRLTKLVNELLEINLIKSGKMNYSWEEASIHEILRRSITTFKANHKNKKVKFISELKEKEIIIVADFDKLIEVFVNLLDNAAKHSDASAPITILLKKLDKSLSISVNDLGEGIKKEDIPKIFEGFYKTENNTKPGMGLGLYLANQIIEKHKGKIKVKSKLGKGSKFEVILPFYKK